MNKQKNTNSQDPNKSPSSLPSHNSFHQPQARTNIHMTRATSTSIAATSENVRTTKHLATPQTAKLQEELVSHLSSKCISQFCHPRSGCCIVIPRNHLLPHLAEKQKTRSKPNFNYTTIAKQQKNQRRKISAAPPPPAASFIALFSSDSFSLFFAAFDFDALPPREAAGRFMATKKSRSVIFARQRMMLMQTHSMKPKIHLHR